MNELQKLIIRGMKDFFPVEPNVILRELADGVKSGKYKMFVTGNSAFAILALPQAPFDIPQVLHFYSEKPGLRTALVGTVLDFVKKKGYNRLRAVNGSGVSDEIWTRLFRHDGWEIKPVKTVFDFEVKA